MIRLLSAKEAKELANKHRDTLVDDIIQGIDTLINQACERGHYECRYRMNEAEYKAHGYQVIKTLKNFGYYIEVGTIKPVGVGLFNSPDIFELTIGWKSYNEPTVKLDE